MKIQHTNQTQINSIASDNAWETADLVVNNGMSVDEACKAQVEGAMDDMFDDENYDAPYDRKQLFEAYKAATIEAISGSPTYLRNYASEHPESYVRDYDAVDPYNEDEDGNEIDVLVRVIKFEGKEYHVIFDDQEDTFFES